MALRFDRQDRVAIIDGVRTPFAKPQTVYAGMSALDLGTLCVAELLQRTGIDPAEIDRVVYGQVVVRPEAPNIGREIVLRCGLPTDVDAYSVSRACATSYQSMASAVEAIRQGRIDAAIVGGADSVSDAPVMVSEELGDVLKRSEKANAAERAQAIAGLRPKDLVPHGPAVRELSTGLSMGESAEKMAKENGIRRAEQDALAHASHRKAAKAWDEGHFDDQVMTVHVPPAYDASVTRDPTVRSDSDIEAYAKLSPVFDRDYGTITAGNSSPLSDGASAALVVRETTARDLGLQPLGFVVSHAFTAVDPREQLLIGPVDAIPAALGEAGMSFEDIDIVDMHEAFAAQVLSVTREMERRGVGRIDWDRFNVDGGSIALGHPFAATGTRQITQTLHAMRREEARFGLCSACAAGGLASAVLLEAA